MMKVSMVFLGGGLGALCRYLLSVGLNHKFWGGFTFGTVAANLIGTFLIGITSVLLLEKYQGNVYLKELISVGFLGGLTTFSTFTLEALNFYDGGRYLALAIYLGANLLLGLGLLILGKQLAHI